MYERLSALSILKQLPNILADKELEDLIVKRLGKVVLDDMQRSLADPPNADLSDLFVDELYNLAIDEAKEVQTYNAKGGYDDFAVRVLKFGPIYYVSAIEFDDYGPFLSQGEASAWAEVEFEPFIKAFAGPVDLDRNQEGRVGPDPTWKEGHDDGSCFWIRPVRAPSSAESGERGYVNCDEERISIEEDFVHDYLFRPFLEKYFDKDIKYPYRTHAFPDTKFEWLDYNLYKYEAVFEMANEMKARAETNLDVESVSIFYRTLGDRLLLMMQRQPNWPYIAFEGP